MKKYLLTFSAVLIIFNSQFISCSGKSSPTSSPKTSAAFTMDKTSAEPGEDIQFTNQSENASSYAWNFGDGNLSTEIDPIHSYSTAGNFTIVLTATGSSGTDSISKSIEITIPINIVPGVSARNISLNEIWATVQGKLGEYTQYGPLLITISGSTYIIHPLESKSLGIYLFLLSATGGFELTSADVVFLIVLKENFIGKTAQGIMMGSTLAEVEAGYGTPEEHDTVYDSYKYDSIGIRFYYNASSIVYEMDIYTPMSSAKIANNSRSDIINYLQKFRY